MVAPTFLAALAGGGGSAKPLRALSPTNVINGVSLNAAAGTQLHTLDRMPIWVGSGDADSMVLSFNGWYVNASGVVTAMPNDYTVVALRIEPPGATLLSQTVPVTFSGSRSVVVTAGSTDLQCDVLTPAMFGLTKFTRGERYLLRLELAVAAAAQKFPTNTTVSYLSGVGIALVFDPAVFNGSSVDVPGVGGISTGSNGGFTQQQQPYMPIVLGTFVTGDPMTAFGTGDSLVQGQNDSSQKGYIAGGFTRSLLDTDLNANPVGGITMACSGAVAANMWGTTNATNLAAPFMRYCKVLYEEFGTNEYQNAPGTAPATTMAHSQLVWDTWKGVGNSASMIFKALFTPRILSPAKLALTSLSSSGTTCTAGYGTAAAPIVGNAVILTDNVPTAYNGTFTVTAVDNVGKTFTYTAGSAPGAATTVGNWNDQYATVANQPPANSAWASGGNARLANEAIVAQVGVGIGGFIPLNSVRGGTNRALDSFYQWVANGTANYVIDQSAVNAVGVHPNAVGYALEAAEIRAALAGL